MRKLIDKALLDKTFAECTKAVCADAKRRLTNEEMEDLLVYLRQSLKDKIGTGKFVNNSTEIPLDVSGYGRFQQERSKIVDAIDDVIAANALKVDKLEDMTDFNKFVASLACICTNVEVESIPQVIEGYLDFFNNIFSENTKQSYIWNYDPVGGAGKGYATNIIMKSLEKNNIFAAATSSIPSKNYGVGIEYSQNKAVFCTDATIDQNFDIKNMNLIVDQDLYETNIKYERKKMVKSIASVVVNSNYSAPTGQGGRTRLVRWNDYNVRTSDEAKVELQRFTQEIQKIYSVNPYNITNYAYNLHIYTNFRKVSRIKEMISNCFGCKSVNNYSSADPNNSIVLTDDESNLIYDLSENSHIQSMNYKPRITDCKEFLTDKQIAIMIKLVERLWNDHWHNIAADTAFLDKGNRTNNRVLNLEFLSKYCRKEVLENPLERSMRAWKMILTELNNHDDDEDNSIVEDINNLSERYEAKKTAFDLSQDTVNSIVEDITSSITSSNSNIDEVDKMTNNELLSITNALSEAPKHIKVTYTYEDGHHSTLYKSVEEFEQSELNLLRETERQFAKIYLERGYERVVKPNDLGIVKLRFTYCDKPSGTSIIDASPTEETIQPKQDDLWDDISIDEHIQELVDLDPNIDVDKALCTLFNKGLITKIQLLERL